MKGFVRKNFEKVGQPKTNYNTPIQQKQSHPKVSVQSSLFESESVSSDDNSNIFPGDFSTLKGSIKRKKYVRAQYNSAKYSEGKYLDCNDNFKVMKKLKTKDLDLNLTKKFSDLGQRQNNL